MAEPANVESNVESIDGRRMRTQRSKAAIIEAALALQLEGVLVPTAQQIADRVGIRTRTFFRHFKDMEALFEASDQHMREAYTAPFRCGDRTGPLSKRVLGAVEQRAAAFEAFGLPIMSAFVQRWRSDVLQSNYVRSNRDLRRHLENWLPELKQLVSHRRESAHAVASFEMWNRLRNDQGLNRKTATTAVADLLQGLMEKN
ncbi:MAG: helix-turn-helix domain-containing protein [Pseudomonadota bacterium]